MLVLDVVIWAVLPFLNFLYWLDVGEEAFISSHMKSCRGDAAVGAAARDIGGALALTPEGDGEDLSLVPPHFSSQNAKSFQKHRGTSIWTLRLTNMTYDVLNARSRFNWKRNSFSI